MQLSLLLSSLLKCIDISKILQANKFHLSISRDQLNHEKNLHGEFFCPWTKLLTMQIPNWNDYILSAKFQQATVNVTSLLAVFTVDCHCDWEFVKLSMCIYIKPLHLISLEKMAEFLILFCFSNTDIVMHALVKSQSRMLKTKKIKINKSYPLTHAHGPPAVSAGVQESFPQPCWCSCTPASSLVFLRIRIERKIKEKHN